MLTHQLGRIMLSDSFQTKPSPGKGSARGAGLSKERRQIPPGPPRQGAGARAVTAPANHLSGGRAALDPSLSLGTEGAAAWSIAEPGWLTPPDHSLQKPRSPERFSIRCESPAKLHF